MAGSLALARRRAAATRYVICVAVRNTRSVHRPEIKRLVNQPAGLIERTRLICPVLARRWHPQVIRATKIAPEMGPHQRTSRWPVVRASFHPRKEGASGAPSGRPWPAKHELSN
jgi:hypothetical protein